MGRGVNRSKFHRNNGCGTCELITQAHYYFTNEPKEDKEKLRLLASLNTPMELVDETLFFIFPDNSLLAFREDKGFYKVDNFLRKSNRRLA